MCQLLLTMSIYTFHIDIRVFTILQGAVAPGLLVQLTDDGWRDLVASYCFHDIFHAVTNQFLDLPLDYFLIYLYNFLGYSLLSPFRMLCRNFILSRTANYVSFYVLFNLCNLLYLIKIPTNLVSAHNVMVYARHT